MTLVRVIFMGSPQFAVPALERVREKHEVAMVVTQTDKRAGRGRRVVPPAVKVVAEAAGIRVIQPKSVRPPEVAEVLESAKADVAVVVAYGKILPKNVLELFPHGCVNIHGSILPRYRGAAPIQRAIMAGDETTGVSIMRLDEGMDTGPVYRITREPIRADDTTESLGQRLAVIGAEALDLTLAEIASGKAHATAQPTEGVSHAPMLAKGDGQVDWCRPAKLVSAHIRGVDPWPGAYSQLAGERLKLYRPTVEAGRGEPGTVLDVDDRGIVVACSEGAVAIAEVQAPGKKRMPAKDFARGRRLAAGVSFE